MPTSKIHKTKPKEHVFVDPGGQGKIDLSELFITRLMDHLLNLIDKHTGHRLIITNR